MAERSGEGSALDRLVAEEEAMVVAFGKHTRCCRWTIASMLYRRPFRS
jgi:hypothetical protein